MRQEESWRARGSAQSAQIRCFAHKRRTKRTNSMFVRTKSLRSCAQLRLCALCVVCAPAWSPGNLKNAIGERERERERAGYRKRESDRRSPAGPASAHKAHKAHKFYVWRTSGAQSAQTRSLCAQSRFVCRLCAQIRRLCVQS